MLSQTSITNHRKTLKHTRTIATDDTIVLARRLASAHRDEVARLVCLTQLWRSLVKNREVECGVSLEPIVKLQAELEVAWMRQQGITSAEVLSATHALERARTTLAYLDSLPD